MSECTSSLKNVCDIITILTCTILKSLLGNGDSICLLMSLTLLPVDGTTRGFLSGFFFKEILCAFLNFHFIHFCVHIYEGRLEGNLNFSLKRSKIRQQTVAVQICHPSLDISVWRHTGYFGNMMSADRIKDSKIATSVESCTREEQCAIIPFLNSEGDKDEADIYCRMKRCIVETPCCFSRHKNNTGSLELGCRVQHLHFAASRCKYS